MTTVTIVEEVAAVVVQQTTQTVAVVDTNETSVVEVQIPGLPGSDGEDGEDGAPGASAARARQYATAESGSNTVSYIGVAPSGSATSAAVWTIRRLTFDQSGALVASAEATSSPSAVWDDYLTEGYA